MGIFERLCPVKLRADVIQEVWQWDAVFVESAFADCQVTVKRLFAAEVLCEDGWQYGLLGFGNGDEKRVVYVHGRNFALGEFWGLFHFAVFPGGVHGNG